ncbi:synaptogenesis protein syg-2-like isoform X1 [Scylla paramamosain]|uniref:synaptogenesis protein syg-2-like isoform X1 n=1 Tax=Scylla paramamosain TaxID=85552 RepID=UPI0030839BF3
MARQGYWKRNRLLVILAVLSYNLTPPATALPGPLTEVRAVEGQEVALPCLADTPDAGGGGGGGGNVDFFFVTPKRTPIPIYQVNNSGGVREQHWAARGYDRRALVERNPTRLILGGITLKDQGVYGCRVRRSSSLTPITSNITLRVVIPPTSLKIYADLDPDTAVTGKVGPYDLGEMVTFSCRVTEGHPIPSVTWWEGSRLLEDTHLIPHTNLSGFSTTTSDITVGPLTRRDLHRKLTCRASNSDLREALEASVTLDMRYPPSSVRIVGKKNGNLTLRAGRKQEVVCEVLDGRPEPTVTLKLDHEVLPSRKAVKQETRVMRRRTTHAAVLEPTEDLGGSEVTCLAESPLLVQQASALLNVAYRPRVEVVIGPNLDQYATEGDAFSLYCQVSANPSVSNVSWSLNGKELTSNSSAKISMDRYNLYLGKVDRSLSGNYRCTATNSEGTGESEPLHLKVRAKPEAVTSCSTNSSNPGKDKTVNLVVECVAEADEDPTKIFTLKVESVGSEERKEEKKSSKPVFTIEDLTDGQYKLTVTAANNLGESPPYTFNHTVCAPPATSGASSISPTPPLLSFSLFHCLFLSHLPLLHRLLKF